MEYLGVPMNQLPDTQLAESGDVHIAYQVVGDGPIDLVYVPGGATPIDLIWDLPQFARNLSRLASFSRLILLDYRGFGSSDRVSGNDLPAMQAWMDDILAVMDAAGCQRGALLANSESGLPAMLLAASHPERVTALALINCYARYVRSPQQPWGMPVDSLERYIQIIGAPDRWGKGGNLVALASSVASDRQTINWFARAERLSVSLKAGVAVFRRYAAETDVTDVLPGIKVPTLVVSRTGARHVRVGHGRFLAERIPNVRYVELPGEDTLPFLGDADDILAELEEFFTGTRHFHDVDRVLATVLFTDIVGSTERAAEAGDRQWRDLLDAHDAIVRRQLDLFRGRAVKSTGDGVLATFDGPARAIRCACAIRDSVRSLGIELRAGLHTGEVELRDDDVGGIAVHIGARIGSMAAPGELLVSRTVKDLVAGSGIRFADRGVHALKGVPDEWQVYAVED
jgi:class 3 adenylate cyclase